ncbi:hypothetical protein COT94_02085 [Candidatus Falkowbacteria bacterium CG10_big_fil_rev_8_21_14_0_10_37_14]|uniref:Uncharacterized protein n=1 Tax=Candidatus Falkowbacteria bacterium CG10_big_fil_rev_8_21_14_0_10_37_14 TaxID=1974561 RepID=A0A2M6WTB7_9BACT|nr:hypothetical protein [Candidatus Falkowbacteria bacterium]PIT96033.1 MAG: hypothetical protein COT94_02085 [Candidatus Falkowbacteria bacterium CG10_big_fil_rev_8_21_14_0_10_37_14]
MLKLTGTIKKEELKDYTRKDGTQAKLRELYIEPDGSIYPIKVNVSDLELKVGKVGDKVTIDVEIFPFYFMDKKRRKAFVDYYIPAK